MDVKKEVTVALSGVKNIDKKYSENFRSSLFLP